MESKELKFIYINEYLPYELRACIRMRSGELSGDMQVTFEMLIESDIKDVPLLSRPRGWRENFTIIPVLRPMSDVTKPITHKGEEFVPSDRLKLGRSGYEVKTSGSGIHNETPLWAYMKFVEWKFDVFGLISEGLAIDINTLEQNPYK